MIADIEFRHYTRYEEEVFVGENGELFGGIVTSLQFRKQQIPSMTWTDWQDVPVVEE